MKRKLVDFVARLQAECSAFKTFVAIFTSTRKRALRGWPWRVLTQREMLAGLDLTPISFMCVPLGGGSIPAAFERGPTGYQCLCKSRRAGHRGPLLPS